MEQVSFLLKTELRKLEKWREIPSIGQAALKKHESIIMLGNVPDGYRPLILYPVPSHTLLTVFLSYARITPTSNKRNVLVHTVERTRTQPWNTGGCYLDPEDQP